MSGADAQALREIILDQGRAQAERDGAIKEQLREVRADVRTLDGKVVEMAKDLGEFREWKRNVESMTDRRVDEWSKWRDGIDARVNELQVTGAIGGTKLAGLLTVASIAGAALFEGLASLLMHH